MRKIMFPLTPAASWGGLFFDQKIDKQINSKIHPKNDHQKTWNVIPKGSQNGTKIDTQTQQKSMRKLVTKKIRKIILNHFSLNSKSIEIHSKNKCFWWFRRLHVRTGKVSKKNQKWDQSPSENRWKIDTKIMPEKGVAKRWKIIQQMIKKGSEKWAKTRILNKRKQNIKKE